MEKYFVNYKQALKLKELGFDEECLAYYDGWNGNTHLIINDELSPKFLVRFFNLFKRKKHQTYSQDYVEYLNGFCTAPLKSQVFDWFRMEYKLKGYVEPVEYLDGTPETYMWFVYNNCNSGNEQLTYEEAEELCIDKLIEIVKNK